MNKKTINIDPEDLLFLDIETVRRNKVLDINSLEYDTFAWTLRDKDTSELPPSEEVVKLYELKGGLYFITNKIVCISIAYIKDTTLNYKSITGTQKEILETVYKILGDTGKKPCGHNVIAFDIPTMRIKALEENIDLSSIPSKINDVQTKPWLLADEIIDTMNILKGTAFQNISLQGLCLLTGIGTPKDDISGADVSRVYYEGGIERIAEYCNNDVIATAMGFLALQGKRDYLTNFVNKGSSNAPMEKLPVLHRLRKLGELNEPIQKEIAELLGKKKVLKKDLKHIEKILKAALFREDFINNDQDTKDQRQEKEESIKEFIASL
jgi:predicted PolB exonuclease-like 3'-5' exonuclease